MRTSALRQNKQLVQCGYPHSLGTIANNTSACANYFIGSGLQFRDIRCTKYTATYIDYYILNNNGILSPVSRLLSYHEDPKANNEDVEVEACATLWEWYEITIHHAPPFFNHH